jgi:hypothetical protein
MNDVRFSEPVILKSPRGLPRKVASSFEALECLDQDWPEWARGRSWRAACRACRDALEGWRSTRDARKASSRLPGAPNWCSRQHVSPHKSRPAPLIDVLRPETSFSGWQ